MVKKDAKKTKKKKSLKQVIKGKAFIQASFNNTLVSVTDMQGNVVSWSSAGKLGFKGARKSTAYAAQLAAENCGKAAQQAGMKEIEISVKGAGNGRESAVRAFSSIGMAVTIIRDTTAVPHNGCRPKKQRRV